MLARQGCSSPLVEAGVSTPSDLDEFPTESRCGYGYYEYYYAEDELYLVRDRIIGEIYFIKAKSPKEAVEKRDESIVADIMEDIGTLEI